ncbi:MAG: transcriptional regulator [Bacteroidia bacterium]
MEALDPVIHQELRLKIMALLYWRGPMSYVEIQRATQATAGNLTSHLRYLQKAEYLRMEKTFKNNYPHTLCALTTKGVQAFERYITAIETLLRPPES